MLTQTLLFKSKNQKR